LLGVVAEFDHELADPDPREAGLEQTEQVGDWHGGEGHRLGRLETPRDAGGCLVGDQHGRQERRCCAACHEDGCECSPQQRRG
jgi:hypothetical protein